MSFVIIETIYDMTLISKIKEQTGPKKLKKIINNLKNFAEEDLKEFPKLKIKIFEEEKEEVKKPEIRIVAPIFGFQHYLEDIKKSNSKLIVNIDDENEGEDTPSDVDGDEKGMKQKDSSDFSEDE